MKSFNYKGITLIALIITIIVMLILAGVTIATLTGENGLLNKSERAAEETQIKGYEEKIRLATTEGNSDALIEPEKYEDEEDILDDIGNIIKKDSQFEEAKIYKIGTGTEDVKLVVVTKEGYVFYVEVDKIKYVGTKEEVGDIILDTEIQIGDILYICNPNSWTNGKVEVTIEIAKEEYKEYDIEYSYDTKIWNKYEEGQILTVVNNNTEIYTRLRSDNTVLKGYATGNITNIDTIVPTISTSLKSTSTGIDNISLSVEIMDVNSGLGKVEWYYGTTNNPTTLAGTTSITTINGSTAGPTTAQTKTYTVTGLSLRTTYYFKVIVYDVAGNQVTSSVISATTLNPTAADVSYTPSDTSWDVENVKEALDYLYSR